MSSNLHQWWVALKTIASTALGEGWFVPAACTLLCAREKAGVVPAANCSCPSRQSRRDSTFHPFKRQHRTGFSLSKSRAKGGTTRLWHFCAVQTDWLFRQAVVTRHNALIKRCSGLSGSCELFCQCSFGSVGKLVQLSANPH